MYGSSLAKLEIPVPDRGINEAFNRELECEREYDRHELDQPVQTNVPLLDPQPKEVYDNSVETVVFGNTHIPHPCNHTVPQQSMAG